MFWCRLDAGAAGRAVILLLDIEGTTTPLSFVHDVLFPYARARLGEFLAAPANAALVDALLRERNMERSPDAPLTSVLSYAGWLMDLDRKSPALKTIQGLIWERGYRTGALVSDVFPDVPHALARWHAAGHAMAIYSSGSALAQRLLFAHTPYGDLTPLLSHFFDTRVGPKRDPGSYRSILAELGTPADGALFVSDIVEELDAARSEGLYTALSVRPGNPRVPDTHQHPIVTSFEQIQP